MPYVLPLLVRWGLTMPWGSVWGTYSRSTMGVGRILLNSRNPYIQSLHLAAQMVLCFGQRADLGKRFETGWPRGFQHAI